ncbi:MAG: hypothetical protein IJN09_00865 [Oscillospiraceae bacterium]|nr:hypothetical protein [Oscillospiraceae bacterium]
MKIGVVYTKGEMQNHGFEIMKATKFGAVEIYKVALCKNASKRRFTRRLKKCIKVLADTGVSVCAAGADFAHLRTGKIQLVCDGERIIRQQAGFAAQSFAEANGISADIVICGGSFSEVVESAKQILRMRRSVYVRSPAFDDIAETIYRDVGVSIEPCRDGNFLEVDLTGGGHFLKFGEKFADFGDITVTIPEIFSEGIPEKIIPQLAQILEISGFLRKKEIKIGYLPK